MSSVFLVLHKLAATCWSTFKIRNRIKILKHVALPLGRTREKRRQPSCCQILQTQRVALENLVNLELVETRNPFPKKQFTYVSTKPCHLPRSSRYVYIYVQCVLFSPQQILPIQTNLCQKQLWKIYGIT